MQLPHFPATRFQGSKRKILPELAALISAEPCRSVVDLYSSSGIAPSREGIQGVMRACGRQVEIRAVRGYQYALSQNTGNQEIFIVAR